MVEPAKTHHGMFYAKPAMDMALLYLICL